MTEYYRELIDRLWHGRKVAWGLGVALFWMLAGLFATGALVSVFTQWTNH